MSPTPDRKLDDPQQTIAELSRQLEERTAERDEALAQQIATAEVLGVINSSSGDLAPVFEAILEKAMRLCEAALGHLWIYDGERAHPAAVRGEPKLVEWMRRVGSVGPFRSARPSPLGRVMQGEPLVHVADAQEEEAYRSNPVYREQLDVGGIRTLLDIGLRKGDALLGVIALYRREVRPFTDKQIALLQNFAAQAVIAMENARLITETREALEQQTATAEVLQVVNSSPGDLAPVFDAMLNKALRLCDGVQGALWLREGDRFRIAASAGLSDEFVTVLRRYGEPGGPMLPAMQRVLDGETVFQYTDLAADNLYREGEPAFKAAVDDAHVGTVIWVTLSRQDVPVGAFAISRREVRPFSDKEIALLQNFAAQAVIAMENARLLTETREALEQQTATAEVLGLINASPGDLAPVFDAMLERAIRLCEATHGHFFNYDGECFHLAAVNDDARYVEWVRQRGAVRPQNNAPLGRISRGERIVHTLDMHEEEIYRTVPTFREQIDLRGVRSQIALGLFKDDTLLGAMVLYRQKVRPFTDKQIALLENFATQAVIAMENARLLTETREALEQQTASADVLGVINSSPGNLAPVFDAMLEKARVLCGFAHGTFNIYDGEYFRTVAFHGIPETFAEVLRQPRRTGPNFERLLRGERVVHIADLTAREFSSDDPINRAAVDAGIRTVLFVPLRKDGALLGYITANRREVRPFTDKQIALLQNFAAQAVIALENARLITETREALEQQTATAEVLQVINSSPGDLAPVFDAILDKAMRLCEAAFGMLGTIDGDELRTVAARGLPQAFVEFRENNPPVHGPGTARARILAGERVVHILDLSNEEFYRTSDPNRRAVVDLGGVRTVLLVALEKDGGVLGHIGVYRQEVKPFTDKQIALLQNFAAQAVIAMENARLLTETREALEQQTATAEVLGVINSSPGDLAPVFDAMLDKALHLCDASFGHLVTSGDGEVFTVAAAQGPPAVVEFLRNRPPNRPLPGTSMNRLIGGERSVHIHDLKAEEAYRRGDPTRRAVVDLGGGRTLVSVGLRKDDALLGAITVYRSEVKPFSTTEIALIENFAAQAVIAMENARLITETREALEQQTATAEVLQVINSSPGDLAPVFDAMVEKAMRLCDAARGALRIYDGQAFHFASVHGSSDAVERVQQLGAIRHGLFEPMTRGEGVVHIIDVRDTDTYRTDPTARERMDLGGIRTWLGVALRKEGILLGAIIVLRQEVRAFSVKQIALLQNFADQAVIAIENARLLGELRGRTEEVAELNRGLEARVAEQVEELGRVGRLKRFLAPQLAELIVSQGDEKILESHRREIVVVFCDLRGYTAFTETAEPEEVLDFLREYHGALGPLVSQFEGTLDQFSGDGIMVFFNDPVPIPDPAERAVRMALAMREAAGKLIANWRRHGGELGFGVGIAQGFATLGQIGFADRSGYTAIGTVCNLAARLCAEAKDGQILISSRVAEAVEAVAQLEHLGNLDLKGLRRPVAAFNVGEHVSDTSP